MSFALFIDRVYPRIAPYIRKTPLLRSDYLSALSGNDVYLKCENLQVTHAFKVRGAMNKVLSIPHQDIHHKKLVTASGGNHGLAVAYAARTLGLNARIYLPSSTPEVKIQAIQLMGGEVKIHGDVWDDANEQAMLLGQRQNYLYISPFDDDSVIQGQATVAYEVFDQLNDFDIMMCSIGGGGLISGISQYIKSVDSGIQVVGVETRGADSMAQSIQAGKLVTLPGITSKAESLGAKCVSERTFQIVNQYVDRLYVVEDQSAVKDQMNILLHEKILVELASSCVVSAYLKYIASSCRNKKVVIVLCGGNAALKPKTNETGEGSLCL